MSDTVAVLVWCPFPDRETAREVASQLLDEKLVACANILGEMESVFEWDGERESDTEVGVILKTSSNQTDRLIMRLGDLHPYDTPAIVAWDCEYAHPATTTWLHGQLGQS